ncbi:hypothetical protein CRM73_01625 [Kocuria sp. CCUG 69068]|nr:hypothetical protein [Kocuria sp. CCUG 69068]
MVVVYGSSQIRWYSEAPFDGGQRGGKLATRLDYARVSSAEHDPALQTRAMEAAGCERIQFGTPIAPSTS